MTFHNLFKPTLKIKLVALDFSTLGLLTLLSLGPPRLASVEVVICEGLTRGRLFCFFWKSVAETAVGKCTQLGVILFSKLPPVRIALHKNELVSVSLKKRHYLFETPQILFIVFGEQRLI